MSLLNSQLKDYRQKSHCKANVKQMFISFLFCLEYCRNKTLNNAHGKKSSSKYCTYL